jgi:hypothetical protein
VIPTVATVPWILTHSWVAEYLSALGSIYRFPY